MDSLADIQKQCAEDSIEWFGEGIFTLNHQALGLGGEAGELLNLVKKVDRGSLDGMDFGVIDHMADELADVLIYTCNIAAILGIDLGEYYSRKREFNANRFSTHA